MCSSDCDGVEKLLRFVEDVFLGDDEHLRVAVLRDELPVFVEHGLRTSARARRRDRTRRRAATAHSRRVVADDRAEVTALHAEAREPAAEFVDHFPEFLVGRPIPGSGGLGSEEIARTEFLDAGAENVVHRVETSCVRHSLPRVTHFERGSQLVLRPRSQTWKTAIFCADFRLPNERARQRPVVGGARGQRLDEGRACGRCERHHLQHRAASAKKPNRNCAARSARSRRSKKSAPSSSYASPAASRNKKAKSFCSA